MNEVFRIVKRREGTEDEWIQDNSQLSRGRPYRSVGPAKAEATRRANRNPRWHYKVQRSIVEWEDI